MPDVLSDVELRGLKEHKYSAGGSTLLDPFMQVYWRWLVEQVPLWWAPNAITLTGLVVNVFTTLILIVYSPDAIQEAPSWAYLLTALGLFIYQSLDAIDGKQARRTNSATPLGELFDHGCDAVSCVVVMLGFCIALQLGREPLYLLFMMITSMFMFYSAHWTTYCTGTLRFGKMDVTEAQFGVMAVQVAAGLCGPAVFNSELPIFGVPAKAIPYAASLTGVIITAYSYFTVIFIQGGVGKSKSTVADTSVLGPAVPISIMVCSAYYIMTYSESRIFHKHPVLYILTFGMLFSKITCKLVVAHMSRSEMELLDSSFVAPLMLVINQHLGFLLPEYFLLWVSFLYTSIDLWLYASRVCRQICDYLDIYCFKITPPPKAAETRSPRRNTNGAASEKVVQADRPQTRSASKQAQPR